MPEYPIQNWNPVIISNNTYPYPMVYIEPEKDFLNYAKDNKAIQKILNIY